MNVFVDIEYSFIRQPIKIALSNTLKDSINYVVDDTKADLIIGSPEQQYHKPCVILTDDPHQFIIQDNALAICPTPTSKDEMDTLVMKVIECIRVIKC